MPSPSDSTIVATASVVLILCYLLPTVIAYSRHHRHRKAILFTNVLMGWTVIGWVITAIWSSTSNVQAVVAERGPRAPRPGLNHSTGSRGISPPVKETLKPSGTFVGIAWSDSQLTQPQKAQRGGAESDWSQDESVWN